MNGRQRFLESLSFGNPDKVFLTTHFGPRQSTLDRWHGEGLPEDDSYIRIHGLEHSGGVSLNFGPLPAYREEVLKEFGDHKIIRDGMGAVVEYEKVPATPGFVTRKWHEFPVKNSDDWEEMRWRYNPKSPARYPDYWPDEVKSLRDREYPLGMTFASLFWRIRDWTGLKNLSIMFYRDPDLVHDMMDFWTGFVLDLTDRLLRDVDLDYIILNEDMAYKGRAMISPDMMREFMVPGYEKWVKKFREHDVPIIMMDCDGYIHELAPVWIEAGINSVTPIEMMAGNDILKLRDELGHNLSFMGGIDKTKIARGGRVLEREFESKVPQLLEDGGYIPSCDHGIPPDVSYQNYCQFISLLKKYCGWES
jgi:uroporphyrinogen decarboxylase